VISLDWLRTVLVAGVFYPGLPGLAEAGYRITYLVSEGCLADVPLGHPSFFGAEEAFCVARVGPPISSPEGASRTPFDGWFQDCSAPVQTVSKPRPQP
jgi:hypothetical protein